MRHTLFLLLAFLLVFSSAIARDQPELKFSYSCKSGSMPFTKFTVIDCRAGNNIGYLQNGYSNNIAPIIFKGSFKDSLAGFFLAEDPQAKPSRELVVFLYSFFVKESIDAATEAGTVKMSMRFFCNSGSDRYAELLRFDTLYSLRAQNINKLLPRSVSECLCGLAQRIAVLSPAPQANVYSFNDLSHLDSLEKLHIPVYNTDKIKAGIFSSYQQFKNNTPEEKEILIEHARKNEIRAYSFADDKKRRIKLGDEVYAVSDGKQVFLNFRNVLYPLRKEGSDFYFDFDQSTFDNGQFSSAFFTFGLAGALVADATSTNNTYRYKLDYINGHPFLVSIAESVRANKH